MDPEINKLRLAKEENLKYREEQNLLKIKADKVYIIIKKEYQDQFAENQRRMKEYENKKVTTDHDGNVILMKNPSTYHKFGQDFIQQTPSYNDRSKDLN